MLSPGPVEGSSASASSSTGRAEALRASLGERVLKEPYLQKAIVSRSERTADPNPKPFDESLTYYEVV